MIIQAHADAYLALLRADTALTVCDGSVPQGTVPPYVLVYLADDDPENPDSRSLVGGSARYLVRAYCHCVGGDQIAARAVAQRVRARLLDVVPVVAGRLCFPIRREYSVPPQPDETTGTVVMDAVSVYRLESVPA